MPVSLGGPGGFRLTAQVLRDAWSPNAEGMPQPLMSLPMLVLGLLDLLEPVLDPEPDLGLAGVVAAGGHGQAGQG